MLAPYCAPCVRISQVVALAIKAKHRVCWGPLQTREDTCKYEPAYIPPRSLGAQPSADEHAPSARNPHGPFQFPTSQKGVCRLSGRRFREVATTSSRRVPAKLYVLR